LPGGADAQQEGGLIFFGSNPTAPPVTAKLDREPQLVRLAATDSSPLGARAKKVLEKIAWPGKPGVPAITVAPLGIVEQQRFGAGRSIYAAQCEACHQDDGRGLPGVGAMLAATPFVVGPPDVTARILLQGKEGNIGLMPALGAAMGDEDVAAVLTYIRRSWGNTGTPVDGDTVKTIRAETAGRTRPWTGEELTALMAGTQR
jgi:mono/diheme cytochrome c family protein